ncbi:hypothetical protein [Pedobacter gandavensis]|nr:hypothetical protein [Pedobacter gandavensis]
MKIEASEKQVVETIAVTTASTPSGISMLSKLVKDAGKFLEVLLY